MLQRQIALFCNCFQSWATICCQCWKTNVTNLCFLFLDKSIIACRIFTDSLNACKEMLSFLWAQNANANFFKRFFLCKLCTLILQLTKKVDRRDSIQKWFAIRRCLRCRICCWACSYHMPKPDVKILLLTKYDTCAAAVCLFIWLWKNPIHACNARFLVDDQ